MNIICAVISVVLIACSALYVRAVMSRQPEILLCIDDNPIGFISDRNAVEEGADLLTKLVYKRTGEVYRYRRRFSYRFVNVTHTVSYLDANKISEILLGYTDFKSEEAAALYIDGEFVCYAKSANVINDIIDKIEREEESLIEEKGAEYLGLAVKIEIGESLVTGEEIYDEKRLYKLLSSALSTYNIQDPSDEEEVENLPTLFMVGDNALQASKIQTVSEKESLNTPNYTLSLKNKQNIPRLRNYGGNSVSYADIAALSDDNIEIDYGIAATAVTRTEQAAEDKPCLTFRYSLYESAILPSPCQTIYEYTPDRLTDYAKVKSVGEDGEEALTYLSVYEGENLVSRTVSERHTVKEPVDEVIMLGTAEITEPGVTTGRFLWPIFYDVEPTITSYYGVRRPEFDGGGYHLGIDIYEPEGTEVYASDGGVVSYVDQTNSYGIMVIIDHDDGLQSCYAHLSAAQVVVGELVRQGQIIALSGNTGATTAPHLHFEIRLDLHTIDPFKYLPDY